MHIQLDQLQMASTSRQALFGAASPACGTASTELAGSPSTTPKLSSSALLPTSSVAASIGPSSHPRSSALDTARPRSARSKTMINTTSQLAFAVVPPMVSNNLPSADAAAYSYTPSLYSEATGLGFFEGVDDSLDNTFDPCAFDVDASIDSSASTSTSPQQVCEPTTPADEDAPQGKEPKIARPPNAWILYRSVKLAEFKEQNPQIYTGVKRTKANRGARPTQANMSKQIAELWAQEPPEVKDHFHREAVLKSVIHAVENPGYRFNPNKGRGRNSAKKAANSKQASAPPKKASKREPATTERMTFTPPRQASATLVAPASAPPATSQYSFSLLSPEALECWPSSAAPSTAASPANASGSSYFPAYSQQRSAGSGYTPASQQSLSAQLDSLFHDETEAPVQVPQYAYSVPSTTGSYLSSPQWTGGLMPALSVDEQYGLSTGTAPSPQTPFSETDAWSGSYSDYGSSVPSDAYAQCSLTTARPYASETSAYVFPSVQPQQLQLQHRVQPPTASGPPRLQVAPPSPRTPLMAVHQVYYQPQAQQSQPILVQQPQAHDHAMVPVATAQSVPQQVHDVPPTEYMPTPSLTKVEGCLEAAMGDYSSTHPKWWPYRHIKVRPDTDGIPLEDFLKSFEEQSIFVQQSL